VKISSHESFDGGRQLLKVFGLRKSSLDDSINNIKLVFVVVVVVVVVENRNP
jgi:hypothetical protein